MHLALAVGSSRRFAIPLRATRKQSFSLVVFFLIFAWVIDSLEYGSITHLLSSALVVKVSARCRFALG